MTICLYEYDVETVRVLVDFVHNDGTHTYLKVPPSALIDLLELSKNFHMQLLTQSVHNVCFYQLLSSFNVDVCSGSSNPRPNPFPNSRTPSNSSVTSESGAVPSAANFLRSLSLIFKPSHKPILSQACPRPFGSKFWILVNCRQRTKSKFLTSSSDTYIAAMIDFSSPMSSYHACDNPESPTSFDAGWWMPSGDCSDWCQHVADQSI
uniref:BTB domain-containing protein n=1 Tax=Panagrellus redivivus TaxID=6233 RepID=A0A7E4W5U5_PANRE